MRRHRPAHQLRSTPEVVTASFAMVAGRLDAAGRAGIKRKFDGVRGTAAVVRALDL